MAQKKYLDQDGLAEVASYVNSRLKTVTEMPSSASNEAVRLYIGETTSDFTKGHIYQAFNFYDWLNYPNYHIYTDSLEPQVGDPTYDADGEIVVGQTIEAVESDYSAITVASMTFTRWNQDSLIWKDITASAGGGDAADITYENSSYPALNTVEAALDNIIDKIYYVEPSITSFTMTPATTEYEIGQSVSDIAFAWTYNKDMVSQTLTDCTLADETVRSATAAGPYTSNKTFTLSASDGENSTSQSKSISFKHKVYWGNAAQPAGDVFDSAFILGLTGKKFATNYKGIYSMNIGSGEYGFLCYPASWGTVSSWWIGGFEVTTTDCGTINFTNASGNTTSFRITRTSQPGLGSITAEVK